MMGLFTVVVIQEELLLKLKKMSMDFTRVEISQWNWIYQIGVLSWKLMDKKSSLTPM